MLHQSWWYMSCSRVCTCHQNTYSDLILHEAILKLLTLLILLVCWDEHNEGFKPITTSISSGLLLHKCQHVDLITILIHQMFPVALQIPNHWTLEYIFEFFLSTFILGSCLSLFSVRDIPMPLVTSGVEHGNLRELALARMKDWGTSCRDVRTREVGIQQIHNQVQPYEVLFSCTGRHHPWH